MKSFKMDRSAVQIVKKGEEEPAWKYWLSQTPEQRISAVEFLRKQYAGTEQRLQRVYTIIKSPRD